MNSGFKMQSNSKIFNSTLSTSKFQTSSHFETKNKATLLTLSDSTKKNKNYCGAMPMVGYSNALNISPILTKSISCFDPIQTFDYFGLGPNHFHNENILEKN
jgi:hypothetical protein